MSDPLTADLIPLEYGIRSEFDALKVDMVLFRRMSSPFYKGEKWAVLRNNCVLNKEADWECNPIPSSRTNAFYKRCRFDTLEAAFETFKKAEHTK